MNEGPLFILGFVGQAIFAARMLLQWIASERAGRSVVPRSFWHLSLLASACVGTYAALTGNVLFLLTVLPGAFIYARMLTLHSRTSLAILLTLAGPIVALAVWATFRKPLSGPILVSALGFGGWLLWLSRFPIQWWISERSGAPALGAAFWIVSLAGACLLLVYASWHGDWVMLIAFAPGPILYTRNLVLIRRSRAERATLDPAANRVRSRGFPGRPATALPEIEPTLEPNSSPAASTTNVPVSVPAPSAQRASQSRRGPEPGDLASRSPRA